MVLFNRFDSYETNFLPLVPSISSVVDTGMTVSVSKIVDGLSDPFKRKELINRLTGHECIILKDKSLINIKKKKLPPKISVILYSQF